MRRLRPVLVTAAAVVLGLVLVSAFDPWDLVRNPFSSERIDRSGPALLEQLEDLSEYRAATAQLQVLVDVEDDTRFVPSFISGERTTFLAFGEVDAVVDFARLGPGAVEVDGESVRVALPPARIGDVDVDPERSYVVNRERGVLDRLGSIFSDNPTSERELYLLSEDKLLAAADDSALRTRAETNTGRMLETLLSSLGFEEVEIVFDEDASS